MLLTLLAIITLISITANDECANCGDALLYVMKILMLPPLLTFAAWPAGVFDMIPQDAISLCFPSYNTLKKEKELRPHLHKKTRLTPIGYRASFDSSAMCLQDKNWIGPDIFDNCIFSS